MVSSFAQFVTLIHLLHKFFSVDIKIIGILLEEASIFNKLDLSFEKDVKTLSVVSLVVDGIFFLSLNFFHAENHLRKLLFFDLS